MTVSLAAARLQKRNDRLEELWAHDQKMREIHASSAWRSGESGPCIALSEMAFDRQKIVDRIHQTGAVPWVYAPHHDNSWLVVQRQRVVS